MARYVKSEPVKGDGMMARVARFLTPQSGQELIRGASVPGMAAPVDPLRQTRILEGLMKFMRKRGLTAEIFGQGGAPERTAVEALMDLRAHKLPTGGMKVYAMPHSRSFEVTLDVPPVQVGRQIVGTETPPMVMGAKHLVKELLRSTGGRYKR